MSKLTDYTPEPCVKCGNLYIGWSCPCLDKADKPQSLLDASGCLCAAGDCEGCNALADAFETMREALGYSLSHTAAPDWQRVADAIAKADKVMTRGR